MKLRLSRNRAFTLIELLVVVAVIALLIAILLPSLGRARERAKLTVCQTHMRAWAIGFRMYSDTSDGMLPLDGDNGTAAKPIGRWDDPSLWFNGAAAVANNASYDSLQTSGKLPRAGANSLYTCPTALDVRPGSGDTVVDGFFQTVGWNASYGAETRSMLLCYALNSQIRGFNFSAANYPGTSSATDFRKFSQLRPEASFVLVAEKRVSPDELPITDANYSKALTQNKVAPTRFAARHSASGGNGGNLAFVDAHVELFSNKQVNAANTATPQYNQPGLMQWNPQ